MGRTSRKSESLENAGIIVSGRTHTILVGLVFFLFGFVVAFALNQVSSANSATAYEELLDEAVATVVAVIPSTDEIAAVMPSINESSAETSSSSAQPVQPANDEPERYPIDVDDDPARGPEDAPVVLVEFGDFKCGFCRRFATTTLEPLLEQYSDQVRFVYRDFPILGDMSYLAALAGECADDQGKFWEYHNLVFANQSELTGSMLIDFSRQLEMNVEQFQSCLEADTHREEITADFEAARAINATGTPTFLINGWKVVGAQSLDAFARIIEAELEAAASDS